MTLIEMSIAVTLILGTVIALWSSLMVLDRNSRRLGEYMTALGIAQGKIEEVRATNYNPPEAPFIAGTTSIVEEAELALDKNGSNFMVKGMIETEIKPMSQGHLVTVTATFTNMSQPYSAQVQTVVNKFSGGQP